MAIQLDTQHIIEIIRDVAKLNANVKINPNTKIIEDLSLDSLSLTKLIIAVSEKSGTTLDDSDFDLQHFFTPNTISFWLQSKKSETLPEKK